MRCWKAAKGLCGAGWNDKVDQWQPIIEAVMKKDNCEILSAAIKIATSISDESPTSVMFVLAVACELVERKK